jgi:hypothetical protein
MKRSTLLGLAAVLLVTATACGPRRTYQNYRVPPRVDLSQHEMIGVVEFDSSAEGQLGELVTSRFTDAARRDQGLVRMLGVGSRTEAMRSVSSSRWDTDTVLALGAEHGVRTLLTGKLTVSDVRPDVSLSSSLRSGSVSGLVDATLVVELIETATGASIWSSSARATHSVGQISVFGGKELAFDAANPDRVYAGLIDTLVEQATRDFQVRWERR